MLDLVLEVADVMLRASDIRRHLGPRHASIGEAVLHIGDVMPRASDIGSHLDDVVRQFRDAVLHVGDIVLRLNRVILPVGDASSGVRAPSHFLFRAAPEKVNSRWRRCKLDRGLCACTEPHVRRRFATEGSCTRASARWRANDVGASTARSAAGCRNRRLALAEQQPSASRRRGSNGIGAGVWRAGRSRQHLYGQHRG